MDHNVAQEVLIVAKRLDEKNLVNAFEGNISGKKDGLIYITPTHTNKSFLDESVIAVIDENGNQIGGSMKPSSEIIMHTLAYRTRSDIGGVVHCHPPFLTAHAICHKDVTTDAYPELMGNFKRIPVAPYGRPHGEMIIKNALPFLEEFDVILLANHGVLSVGETVIEAMNKVEAAEAIAKTLFFANMIGKQQYLNRDECDYFYSCKNRAE
jgi:L-fuculose-phosphate aldolase